MEKETPETPPNRWQFQFAIREPARLLACIWGGLALLLLLSFLLPNYSMAVLEMNGWDAFRMAFKDTENLRKMVDDSSYLLMVIVPLAYLMVGLAAAVSALRLWRGKGRQMAMFTTGIALVVWILALVGYFTIGANANQMPFFGKLMPKPIYGYHLALVWQGLVCLTGIAYWALETRAGQSRA
jgi:hypothetical protein